MVVQILPATHMVFWFPHSLPSLPATPIQTLSWRSLSRHVATPVLTIERIYKMKPPLQVFFKPLSNDNVVIQVPKTPSIPLLWRHLKEIITSKLLQFDYRIWPLYRNDQGSLTQA